METKLCNHCDKKQDIELFAFANKIKGTRKPTCKECDKIKRKVYYEANKKWIIADNSERNKVAKTRNSQYVWDYLKKNPCVDCGQTNPIVLDFDHRDGVDKIDCVSRLIANTVSIETLQEEIDKCDIRCANCHRIRTAKQQNWYSNIDL